MRAVQIRCRYMQMGLRDYDRQSRCRVDTLWIWIRPEWIGWSRQGICAAEFSLVPEIMLGRYTVVRIRCRYVQLGSAAKGRQAADTVSWV